MNIHSSVSSLILAALFAVSNWGSAALAQEVFSMAAPLPEAARGPAIDPAKGYFVEEIRDGLFWVTDGVYTTMFLTTGSGVIAVDAPPSLGENYLRAIAEVTDEPVTHLIYSHAHRDHIGAANIFPNDLLVIAHEETAALLERANDSERPLPEVTFAERFVLEVGSQRLELEYLGVNHEPGNIFIYAPEQEVLMLVDVIFPGWVPFKNLALAKDIPGFVRAHDEVLRFDFESFIGGHMNRPGSREDVQIQRAYVHDVMNHAAQAIQKVELATIAAEVGVENPWLLFDTYLDALAEFCADATLPDWIDELGGADVFTFDHCWVMVESLRID